MYHLIHACALGLVGVSSMSPKKKLVAGTLFTSGIILFSGSLYGLAAGGPRWLGPITPLGGVAFMAGWVLVIAAALAKDE